MKAYQTRNGAALRKRVRKAHSKAKFAGFLYLLGALACMVLACLPMLKIDGTDLWVVNFWKPFLGIFGANRDLLAIATSALYAIILLTCLINLLSSLGKLRWLTRNGTRYVNAYNKNMRAMDDMGKLFSGSFAAILNFYLLIYILQPSAAQKEISTYAYILLGAGLFIHFLAGLVSGKVSFFNVGSEKGNVVEEKREYGLFVYFFRNLVQVAATAAIIYFFLPVCTLGDTLQSVLNKQNPFSDGLLKTAVPVALQALTLLWVFVLVKHATATTEFNRFGIEGTGMKNYRVFSFFTFLTAGGAFALEYLNTKLDAAAKDYLIIAGVAFVAFLVDCIFKSRVKEQEEEEQAPVTSPVAAPTLMPATYPQQNNAQQPSYVPVYYPYPVYQQVPVYQPVGQPVYQPVPVCPYPPVQQPTEVMRKPQPCPAPEYLKPSPSPAAQATEGKNEAREKRREIKDRDDELKRAKAEAKKGKKISKKNAKAEKKLSKKENKLAQQAAPLTQKVGIASAAMVGAAVGAAAETPVETPTTVIQPPVVEPRKEYGEEWMEIHTPLDPNKKWRVRCPRCGKELMVRETSPYHRCPACDKVFSLRKFEAYVRK